MSADDQIVEAVAVHVPGRGDRTACVVASSAPKMRKPWSPSASPDRCWQSPCSGRRSHSSRRRWSRRWRHRRAGAPTIRSSKPSPFTSPGRGDRRQRRRDPRRRCGSPACRQRREIDVGEARALAEDHIASPACLGVAGRRPKAPTIRSSKPSPFTSPAEETESPTGRRHRAEDAEALGRRQRRPGSMSRKARLLPKITIALAGIALRSPALGEPSSRRSGRRSRRRSCPRPRRPNSPTGRPRRRRRCGSPAPPSASPDRCRQSRRAPAEDHVALARIGSCRRHRHRRADDQVVEAVAVHVPGRRHRIARAVAARRRRCGSPAPPSASPDRSAPV